MRAGTSKLINVEREYKKQWWLKWLSVWSGVERTFGFKSSVYQLFVNLIVLLFYMYA